MSDKNPRHYEIVTERYPAQEASTRRRRWCATCDVWTWEVWPVGSGVFRHGKGSRTYQCRAADERRDE